MQMAKEICKIRGHRQGLVLSLAAGVPFSETLDEVRVKLGAAGSFFRGAKVRIDAGRPLSDSEQATIIKVIQEFDMVLATEDPTPVATGQEREPEIQVPSEQDQTRLVRRTLRSGQKLYYDGNVVVFGDINPGAEVVASGDIMVLGSLRGVAHAGAKGRMTAIVFAFRLEPTQLRIGNYISRAPDAKGPSPDQPEIACVDQNVIQIRAYQGSGLGF